LSAYSFIYLPFVIIENSRFFNWLFQISCFIDFQQGKFDFNWLNGLSGKNVKAKGLPSRRQIAWH